MKKLIIDGNWLFSSFFFASNNPQTNSEKDINQTIVASNVLNKIVSFINSNQYGQVFVCFDTDSNTFRKQMYEAYKANRPKDKMFGWKEQFAIVKEGLKLLNIPTYNVQGFEADDIIATIAKQLATKDKIVIYSRDADLKQLLSENISILNQDSSLYTKQNFINEFGLEPQYFNKVKAIGGDVSDNYTGAYGIGLNTACKLLNKNQFSIDEIITKSNEFLDLLDRQSSKTILKDFTTKTGINEKIAKAIVTENKNLKLFEELATLRFDVPIEIIEDVTTINYSPEIISFCDKYKFNTLKKNLQPHKSSIKI